MESSRVDAACVFFEKQQWRSRGNTDERVKTTQQTHTEADVYLIAVLPYFYAVALTQSAPC